MTFALVASTTFRRRILVFSILEIFDHNLTIIYFLLSDQTFMNIAEIHAYYRSLASASVLTVCDSPVEFQNLQVDIYRDTAVALFARISICRTLCGPSRTRDVLGAVLRTTYADYTYSINIVKCLTMLLCNVPTTFNFVTCLTMLLCFSHPLWASVGYVRRLHVYCTASYM